jgi:hypothetical protein
MRTTAVVSTHLQDATVKVADVLWRPWSSVWYWDDRFDWPAAVGEQPALRRCRSALRFERARLQVQAREPGGDGSQPRSRMKQPIHPRAS